MAMAMDAHSLYADTIAPVCRENASDLFLLTLEARPKPDSEDYGEVGGAFVNCWVDAEDLRSAELRAIALIEKNGWQPHRFDSWDLVNRSNYENCEPPNDDAPDPQAMFEQALVDGEACEFHTWPINAPDA